MTQRPPVEIRTVDAGEDGMRLDRWFRSHYAGLTHSRLEKLLRTGQVRVDGGRAKASTRLAAGQTVRVPPLPAAAPVATLIRLREPIDSWQLKGCHVKASDDPPAT